MRDDHTGEQEGQDGVQGLKLVAGGMTTIEGVRGAIKKRMAQIEKRTVRLPAITSQKCRAKHLGVCRLQKRYTFLKLTTF
jgi:hypothetical protein